MGCVYLVTNLLNGKKYVGKTLESADYRWRAHCDAARRGSDRYLHNSIRKHGPESFSVEVLAESDDELLLFELESRYILEFNTKSPNGYNLTDGGEGSSGCEASDSRKEKSRESNIESRHLFAALTDDEVRAVRAEYEPFVVSIRFLAKKYGVSYTTIQRIVSGETFSDLT